jgi:hypothetical protein
MFVAEKSRNDVTENVVIASADTDAEDVVKSKRHAKIKTALNLSAVFYV